MKNIKKKKMKRLTRRGLSLLLALIMCLGMIQTTAFAAEDDAGIVAESYEDVSDEDTPDEDVSDEDTSNEDTSDEDTSNEDASDEDASDEDASDEVTSDEDTSGGDTSDEVTSDADTSGGDTSGEVTSDTAASDEAAPAANTPDGVNAEGSPADGIIMDAAAMGAPAADTLVVTAPANAAGYATIEDTPPYVTVVHKYYTNGNYDGEYTEERSEEKPSYSHNVTISDIEKRCEYNGETYKWDIGQSTITAIYVQKGATGNQGTFTLIYNRTIEVTLTYNANGGTNPPEGVTTNKGTDVKIKDQESMIYDGFEFLGWNTNKDATTANLAPGDTVTLNADTTLYAVWQKKKDPVYNYALYYDANTPDGVRDEDVDGMPETQTKSTTSTTWSFTVSGSPSIDGYTFAGWYPNKECTGKVVYWSGNTVSGFTPANPTRTLYAKWDRDGVDDKPAEYTVTVRYEDEDGNEIRGSETGSTTNGGNYDVTGKKLDSIDGYKFKEVKDGNEGILKGTTDKDITITLIYTADSEKADYKIVHEYYTNGVRDSISIPDDAGSAEVGSRITVSDSMKKLTAGGNSYRYTSASAAYIILDSDASRNVIILRYDRTTGGGNGPEPTPSPDPDPTPNPTPNPEPDPTPDPVPGDDGLGSGGTEPETSGEEPTVAAEIPNQQLPLAQTPVEQPRLLEITDGQTPLARIPGGNGALAEIPDEEVPLAAVPKTGDLSGLWYAAVILSAAGLLVLALMERRAKK